MNNNKIELVAHDDFWNKVFEKESIGLKKLLRNNLLGCEHIGSTAIPSILARPTLDIMCVVHTFDGIEIFLDDFKKAGYTLIESSHKRFLFTRFAPDSQRHLTDIYIFKKGDELISDYLDFRDYLNSEDTIAKEFDNMKKSLVKSHPSNLEIYQEAKANFIEAVVSKLR